MDAADKTYTPGCVVCGPDADCEQPVLEGVVSKVERRMQATSKGGVNVVRIVLESPQGPCRLDLGERFAYLSDGLSAASERLSLRAYHLRRARKAGSPGGARHSCVPTFLSGTGSIVLLEPDWLLNVTALIGTDYCLRQWLANRLAARPASLPQLRGTLVHAAFQTLCRLGTVLDDTLESLLGDMAYGLALAGVSQQALIDDVRPHVERLARWHAECRRGALRRWLRRAGVREHVAVPRARPARAD